MKRFMTKFAVGALVLGSVALYGVNAASAATPSMTVTPTTTGLTAGQALTVSGSGFTANATLAILECTLGAADASGCDTTNYVLVTASATGTFPATTFHVFAGPTGTGTCDMGTTDTSCTLAVGNINLQTEKASVTISFGAGGTTTTTTITSGTTTTTTTTPPATTTTTTVPTSSGPRKLTVRPSTGLKNRQVVKVSGSGFTPGDHVFIVECLKTGHSSAQCALSTLKAVTISSGGKLPTTSFKVITGKIGTGTCGTKATNKGACSVSVANAAKGDSARVPISFK
jgi:hypothetical protein